jgi:hypothetical protein
VVLHGRFPGLGRPRPMIVVNILRVENGRLAEHWDVVQDEATGAEGRRPWRKNAKPHERAFLRGSGPCRRCRRAWRASLRRTTHILGRVGADAWSYALPPGAGPGLPILVLEPRKPSRPTNLGAMHNIDPFVFDGPFLYSNCRQPKSPALRSLERGDVVFFGSQLGGHFVLDTVFVVRDRYPYRPARWREATLPEPPDLARTNATRELDHVLAAVFGFWDRVISDERLFSKSVQLSLLPRGPRKAEPRSASPDKKAADEER